MRFFGDQVDGSGGLPRVGRVAGGGEEAVVNVAEVAVGTRALGPGTRSAVWVQGCPLRCPGCLAPEWLPDVPARLVPAGELAAELLSDPDVSGLTLSGGEPMAQAAGLAAVVLAARALRDVDVVCYTGFPLAALRRRPPGPGVDDLLALVDVLIDGPYAAGLDDGAGLRGSSNQTVHHLTDRLAAAAAGFTGGPRRVEIRITGSRVQLIGVPPAGLLAALGDLRPGGGSGSGRAA